jgi:hypothetical protein
MATPRSCHCDPGFGNRGLKPAYFDAEIDELMARSAFAVIATHPFMLDLNKVLIARKLVP